MAEIKPIKNITSIDKNSSNSGVLQTETAAETTGATEAAETTEATARVEAIEAAKARKTTENRQKTKITIVLTQACLKDRPKQYKDRSHQAKSLDQHRFPNAYLQARQLLSMNEFTSSKIHCDRVVYVNRFSSFYFQAKCDLFPEALIVFIDYSISYNKTNLHHNISPYYLEISKSQMIVSLLKFLSLFYKIPPYFRLFLAHYAFNGTIHPFDVGLSKHSLNYHLPTNCFLYWVKNCNLQLLLIFVNIASSLQQDSNGINRLSSFNAWNQELFDTLEAIQYVLPIEEDIAHQGEVNLFSINPRYMQMLFRQQPIYLSQINFYSINFQVINRLIHNLQTTHIDLISVNLQQTNIFLINNNLQQILQHLPKAAVTPHFSKKDRQDLFLQLIDQVKLILQEQHGLKFFTTLWQFPQREWLNLKIINILFAKIYELEQAALSTNGCQETILGRLRQIFNVYKNPAIFQRSRSVPGTNIAENMAKFMQCLYEEDKRSAINFCCLLLRYEIITSIALISKICLSDEIKNFLIANDNLRSYLPQSTTRSQLTNAS